jgi:hypothetical protein
VDRRTTRADIRGKRHRVPRSTTVHAVVGLRPARYEATANGDLRQDEAGTTAR